MPRARARQFFSSGLGFGLETQKPGLGLETCWTRTRVLHIWTRARTRDMRTRTRLGLVASLIVFFPVLSMCMYPFRYHYVWAFLVSFRSFSVSSVLFGVFSVLLGVFSVFFGPFRSLSVLFGVYSYRIQSIAAN